MELWYHGGCVGTGWEAVGHGVSPGVRSLVLSFDDIVGDAIGYREHLGRHYDQLIAEVVGTSSALTLVDFGTIWPPSRHRVWFANL